MADQTESVSGAATPDARAVLLARVGLLMAAAGALFVVLNLWGLAVLGLVLGIVGALLAVPLCWGERWHIVLLSASIVAVFAKLIAGSHQTFGGWLAVLAAIAMLVGAALSYPMEEE